ncbi:sap30 [Anaeramoeba ignava]|uniref:Sap30 n=1 Tax=Anaeramoeba ignava TaxID=1746090 RepID=A0A9Q0LXJ5_ANAIG|nr:sap30 [Anaeramoeba ignava]
MGRKNKRGTNPRDSRGRYTKINKTKIDFSKLDSHSLKNLKKYYNISNNKFTSYKELAILIAEKFHQQKVDENQVIRNFLIAIKTLI